LVAALEKRIRRTRRDEGRDADTYSSLVESALRRPLRIALRFSSVV
jgi:hypothetical protein